MTDRSAILVTTSLLALCLLPGCKERGEVERESLAEAGYSIDQQAYFRAAESDDVRAMKSMIDSGLALDSIDAMGRSALHAAAGSGAMQSITFLLDRRVDVNVRDGQGRTPLMEAVLRSTPETVRFLLRQGADPALKDGQKYKPLMLAVRDGRTNMVSELAPYVREDLDDALLAAAILGQAGVIDELTNFGASIYARIDDGRTPLMLAAQNGHADAVELLLEIGANRFAVDSMGRTAELLAADAGHGLIAGRLAEAPQEGDFELSEPAELGVEMVAMMEDKMVETTESELSGQGRDIASVGTSLEEAADEADSNAAGDAGAVAALDPAADWKRPLPLEGAVVDSVVAMGEPPSAVAGATVEPVADPPMVMRSYRQRQLPLTVESADKGVATIKKAGGEPQKIGEGSTIPGTSLKVVRIHRRMQSGKENAGEPVEVSVVEIKDTDSGVTRDLVAELPAMAHDPVALVEDTASGRFYVARTGQRFKAADGSDYLVGDVRPNQIVIEDLNSGETVTIPLRGPRG